jgi:amidase
VARVAGRGNAIRYGQSNLDISDEMDLRQDRARYDADRAKDLLLAEERGLKAAIASHQLDALLFPGWPAAGIASRPGYPIIVVPFGAVAAQGRGSNPYPAGFDPKPSPYSVGFVGLACSEPRLIELTYAFEQATKRRVPPAATP